MVQCHLNGRLGNNIFQMAATIGHAINCSQDFILPRWKYSEYFNLQTESLRPGIPPYQEPSFHYNSIPCSGDLELRGYFQSQKYWSHCIPLIKQIFTPIESIITYINTHRSKGTLTGIHIRRDDYLKLDHFYHILSQDYYNKALSSLSNPGKTIIFSDDIPWCRANFPGDYYSTGNPIQDLFLLSSCDNIIMANSSFSWWAAFFSKANVIAPKDWFKPISGHDTKDLYLPQWTQL